MSGQRQRYLVALGSNQRHHRYGRPPAIIRAALVALEEQGLTVMAASRVFASRPLGPSQRTYANAAAVIASALEPDALLDRLKAIERAFGRRRGRRWSARVLDLDIVLWGGGAWSSPGLTVPHVAFRDRLFVLEPAVSVAPEWRDPLTGRALRHLARRRYNF